jgi:hypothetical protein
MNTIPGHDHSLTENRNVYEDCFQKLQIPSN